MTAYVLAGGRGSRLAPFHSAKTLLTINGISMLQRILEHLRESGRIEHVVVCTGYRHNDVVASVRAHGWTTGYVTFWQSPEEVAMGERLLGAHSRHLTERALVIYADELANVNLEALTHVHEQHPTRVMTFTATYATVPGGSVDDSAEGPRIVESRPVLMNIGFVLAEPSAWDYLQPTDGVSDWINRVRDRVGEIGLYYHTGKRATVNSLADLPYAEEIWR